METRWVGKGRIQVRGLEYCYNAKITGKYNILRYDNDHDLEDYHKHVFVLWIEFLQDSSFSLGFLSRVFKFTEYGSAIARSGYFTEHVKILTSGNVDIKDADSPHVTFHPPKIRQDRGVVHMVAKNGLVDEFELDWFPVKKDQTLLYAFTGDIAALDKAAKTCLN
ncbi:unnamed protein product, partial [marine sediment metagenome]